MSVPLAFVILAPKASISSSKLRAGFVELFPEVGVPTIASEKGGTISFDFPGERSVLATLVPKPYPREELEGFAERSWMWQKPKAALLAHAGHMICAGVPTDDPIEGAKLLTMAVAAICKACPQTIAVLWSSSELLIPADAFAGLAEQLPEALPVYLWVNVFVGKNDAGTTSGFTKGLEFLGHMEFETNNASDEVGDLRERFLNLAAYVLENGPVIEDGNTVGADENERIRVIYSDSEFGNEGTAMRLDYESLRKKRR